MRSLSPTTNGELLLTNMTKEDEGVYECEAASLSHASRTSTGVTGTVYTVTSFYHKKPQRLPQQYQLSSEQPIRLLVSSPSPCMIKHYFAWIPVLECPSNPCKNGGRCVESAHGYQCRCSAWTGGRNCDQGNPHDVIACFISVEVKDKVVASFWRLR